MTNGVLDQSVDCDAVLVKNTTSLTENSQVRLAWLKSINQSSYESAKQDAGASFLDMFSGDYNSFNDKRNQLLSQESFSLSQMESRQLLLYKVPDTAIAAWRACITEKMNEGSLASWVERMDADGGTLMIRWKLSPAAPTLRNVKISLVGGTDLNGKTILFLDSIQGEKIVLIKRPPTNKEVRGTVEGKAGAGGDFASSFFFPPVPQDDMPGNHGIPTLVEIMAKNFNRSLNVEVGVLPYGADVIHNAPPYNSAENMVEYDFYLPHSGTYDFEVEYAALAPRPVEISLKQKGTTVFNVVGLQDATGGWSNQQFRKQLTAHLSEGPSTLRLHRNDVFPHIRTLRFNPVAA